jgi:hypothetical protein
MMAFRAGQKVVCIDDDGAPMLTKGQVYTIKSIDPLMIVKWRQKVMKMAALHLYEIDPDPRCHGFAPLRFRPAVDRKFDISIFTRMLRTKSKAEV